LTYQVVKKRKRIIAHKCKSKKVERMISDKINFNAIKSNKFVGIISLKIRLSEISQTQKAKSSMLSLKCGI
jgi:hypothetical protein